MTFYIAKGHFMVFKLKGFQLLAMIVCFNWLSIGSNIYHYFLYMDLCLN